MFAILHTCPGKLLYHQREIYRRIPMREHRRWLCRCLFCSMRDSHMSQALIQRDIVLVNLIFALRQQQHHQRLILFIQP